MKVRQLKEIIEEVVYEVLSEQPQLKTSTQEILGKFPTLRRTLINLMTRDFEEFVDEVKWIAPKPTTFEIVLRNGQIFFLKWTGKGFEGQIQGKKYYLNSTDEFQQALDKLNELLKHTPPKSQEDEEGFEDEGTDDLEGFDEPEDSEPEEEL